MSDPNHNLNGITACFAGCDKKTLSVVALMLLRLSKSAEQIPSNFQTQRHALEQCIDRLLKFYIKAARDVVADWHKLHITLERSRTTLIGIDTAFDARKRPDGLCAPAGSFALKICSA